MKIALQENLISFDSFPSFLRACESLGLDGVEVWGDGLEKRLGEVKAALDDSPLKALGICPGCNGVRPGLLSDDPRASAGAMDDIRRLLDLGAELGCPGLNVVPEFGVEKFMRLSPRDDVFRTKKNLAIDAFGELAAHARQTGTDILIEPLNRYEAFFLYTLDQAAEICETVGGGVKVLADLFHMSIEESDSADALLRNARWIGEIHLADSNRRPPGFGQNDFARIARALDDMNFQGPACFECAFTENHAEEIRKGAALFDQVRTSRRGKENRS